MKNYLSFIAFFLFLSGQAMAQEVPEQQRPLISKVAATWCPPCGGWGWTMFENLIEDNQNKATLLVAHHSGDLVNGVSEDFSDNFDAPYQPYFYVNLEDQEVSGSNADAKRTEIKNKVDAAYQESPIANTGMNLVLTGNGISVETKTRFFQEATGEFYLGIYYVESNIVNFQASQGNNAIHDKILRGAITAGSFGELLIEGDVAAGTEFTQTYTSTLINDFSLDHLEIVTIIWKKEGEKYDVVNTNVSNDFFVPVAVSDVELDVAKMEVMPTVTTAETNVSIVLENDLERAQLNLYDLNGKKVHEIFSGMMAAGESTYTLNKSAAMAKGMYFIVLQSDDKVLSKRVVFE